MKARYSIEALKTSDFVLFQLMRYGTVGFFSVISFLVISNVTFLLTKQAYLSSGIGWFASFLISFMGHTKFSFRIEYRNHKLIKFFMLALINLLVAQVITHYGQIYFAENYWIISILIVCVIPLYSFILSKLFIFT